MSRSKQYIESLLNSAPLDELATFEHRETFQQLKDRLSGAEDIQGELKALYRVNNFSDFALSLLWIAEKVERDPSMLETMPEDQTLVLALFRHAVGDRGEDFQSAPAAPPVEPSVEPAVETPSAFGEVAAPAVESPFGFGAEPTAEAPSGFGPAADAVADFPAAPSSEPTAAPAMDFPSFPSAEPTPEPMADFPSAPATEPAPEPMSDFPSFPSAEPEPIIAAVTPPAPAGDGSPETQFAQLVEKCVEAIQTGAADRDAVKDQMLAACAAVLADGSAAEDYRNFCQIFTEFITYIYDNQFVDDIRVMNLLSNVADPVWAWARADAASREGMMNAAYDSLREFKSLFE